MMISATRYLPSMSEQDQILDEGGEYLKRNTAGTPQKSAITLLKVTLV